MNKGLSKFINSSILSSVIFIVLGFVMLLFPKTSLNVFAYSISLLLIIEGFYLVILDFKLKNMFWFMNFMLPGILLILLGVILCIYPNTLSILIPIVLGSWFILSSIFKIRFSLMIKDSTCSWIGTLILSILSVICGIILIINPTISSITITILAGIMLIIYSVSDIINMLIFKKNVKKIEKYFKTI